MVKKILLIFVLWRLSLFLPLFISEHFLRYREGFDYTSPSYFSSISHFLLAPWGNFDAVYYLIIAAGGYTVDNSVFFPLFPLLINVFSLGSQAFSTVQFMTGIILPSVLFFLALFTLRKLLAFDYKDTVITQSIIFLVLFPTSFFFATIYSESLFLFLTTASFYFARNKNWFLASIFALFLTATRFVGIAIIPVLLYEFIKTEKNLFLKRALPLFLAPVGLISYAYFNFKEWGSPLMFSVAQENLQNERVTDEIILLPQTIYRYFNILTSVSPSIFEWWIALLEISVFAFAFIMVFIAWKKKVRSSYVFFAGLALLIPALTGTLTGMPRYVLVAFPVFMALALLENRWIKYIYCAIGVILLIILFALFSKGYYIS